MLSKITFSSLLLFLFCAGILFFTQIQEHPSDVTTYQTLLEENQALGERKSRIDEPATQSRTGVQKDIWTVRDHERMQFSLKCENSDLVIKQRDKKIEVTEYLHNLECMSQEGLNRNENNQEIRAMTSVEGIYYFPSHQFLAEKVNLFFYHLPGLELPLAMPLSDPYLRGRAYDVAFRAEEKALQFSAHHLKANFDAIQVHP